MTKMRCIVNWSLPDCDLLALEGVEDGLALAFGGLEFLEVLAVDEEAGDETDEEAGDEEDEVGHRLGKFELRNLGVHFGLGADD
jgi:hypothetical protein